METIPYFLYLSNFYRDRSLILGEIEVLQLVPDVVFEIVLGLFDVVSVQEPSACTEDDVVRLAVNE